MRSFTGACYIKQFKDIFVLNYDCFKYDYTVKNKCVCASCIFTCVKTTIYFLLIYMIYDKYVLYIIL